MTTTIYSSDFWNLTAAEKEYAALNLNEDENRRAEQVEELRQWILDSKEFHARTDDAYMLQFLRGCKFDMKKAKKKFRNYHELKYESADLFANRDPYLPEIQEMLALGIFLPLSTLDDQGRTIIIIRAAAHDPRLHKQSDVFKVSQMVLELAARDSKPISLYGVTAILDLANVTLGHALQLTPAVVKRAVHSWQSCYPMRTNSMDFVNAPIYVNVVLNIFRNFMTVKMKSRVHVHMGGLKNLHKKVSPSLLPVEYGGTCSSVAELTTYWKEAVEKNRDWFRDEEKYNLIV